MTLYQKIFFAFIALLFLMTQYSTNVWAQDQIVFENPSINNPVFEKREIVKVSGYAKIDKNIIKSAQISFDGMIWHDLKNELQNKDNNYYYWSYNWDVAGKGKTFIQVQFTTKSGDIIEGRKIVEIKSTSEENKENLKELLKDYQIQQNEKIEDSKKRSKFDAANPLMSIEYYINNNFGNFVANNWMVLLPTSFQQEYFLAKLNNFNQVLVKYPAIIDIMLLLIWPYLIYLSINVILFLIIPKISDFFEIVLIKIILFFQKNKNNTASGYVFDSYALECIPYAKIIFSDASSFRKYISYTNSLGKFRFFNLPVGEYSYEIEKNGYNSVFTEKLDLNEFKNNMVITGNFQITDIKKQNVFCLPISRIIDRDRIFRSKKANWFHLFEKIFFRNVNVFFNIGIIFLMIISMLGEANKQLYFIFFIIIFGYLVYREVVRIPHPWGRIFDFRGEVVEWLKIGLLDISGKRYSSTWSNEEGYYSFGEIDDIETSIIIDNPKWQIINNSQYFYQGQKISKNNKESALPINILVNKKR